MEEMMDKLVRYLDLTFYEAKAYVTLLIHGPLTMTELSDLSGVPRLKCYPVAKSLVLKGMATLTPSRPMKCQSLPPSLAIKNRLAQLAQELENKKNAAESLLTLLEALSSQSPRQITKVEQVVSLIEGLVNTISFIKFDLERTKQEALVAISSTPVRFDWRELLSSLARSMEKGGSIKLIVPSSGILAEAYRSENVLEWLKEGKLSFRVYGNVHQPFSVFDVRVVYVFFTDPQLKELLFSVRMEDPRFAKLMKGYFDLLWERAAPPK
ncbi:MAG: hypothetical protein DRJ98_04730 [Thermoprotei archaeon]|nr:MAG: hypothetical protein DRJ98_04730 [Thermoprotei archaeon]